MTHNIFEADKTDDIEWLLAAARARRIDISFQDADCIATHFIYKVQKAREEEKERGQVKVLAAISGLQEALDDAPLTFPQDMDITEVPDGLANELRGMKKGWQAALEQLKQQILKD